MQARPTLIFALVGVASAALAQREPPPPAAPVRAASYACTRQTLLDGQLCTIEGRSTAQAPSQQQAMANLRQASAFAEELCATVARADDSAPDATVLAACRTRVSTAVRACGGDGKTGLQDDAGRFNPGFARCYAGLAELVRGARQAGELADGCCACAHASCAASVAQCVERASAGLELGACVEGRCRAECAAALLIRRPAAQAAEPTGRGATPARKP